MSTGDHVARAGNPALADGGLVRGYTIAHLPGDGIGPEVTAVPPECVDAGAVRHRFVVEWRTHALGAQPHLAPAQGPPHTGPDRPAKARPIPPGPVGSTPGPPRG